MVMNRPPALYIWNFLMKNRVSPNSGLLECMTALLGYLNLMYANHFIICSVNRLMSKNYNSCYIYIFMDSEKSLGDTASTVCVWPTLCPDHNVNRQLKPG